MKILKKLRQKLDNYSQTPINQQMVEEIFYIQDLIAEVSKNVSVKININQRNSPGNSNRGCKNKRLHQPKIKAVLEVEIEEKKVLSLHLKLRSALNGDLIILDHKDIDIVIQPKNNKVVTFAKDIII